MCEGRGEVLEMQDIQQEEVIICGLRKMLKEILVKKIGSKINMHCNSIVSTAKK